MDNRALRVNGSHRAAGIAAVMLSLAICTAPAMAQTVSGVSGTVQHGATITISGSSFGTKPTAAPLVYDDIEGGSFDPRWSSTTHLSPNGTESRHPNPGGSVTAARWA